MPYRILVVVSILLGCVAARPAIAETAADPAADSAVIELPAADRAALEKYLGDGVVGKAVPGNPIADAPKFFAFEDGTWEYRFTGGDAKGTSQDQSFKKLDRDATGTKGRYQNGPDTIYFLHQDADGSVSMTAEQDTDEGVISRFSPPQPFYVAGMQPGESKQTTIDVKVYDLKDLEDVSHTGSLNLTYSYIGAYEVTVPAGTFEAALVKWVFEGKVGPASVDDTQYRLMANGPGAVALVDRRNISALLIYHDTSQIGKVLVGRK